MPTKRWVIKKVWTGKPVYCSVLKIFGCHVQSREWSKLNPKVIKSVYFLVSRLVLRAIRKKCIFLSFKTSFKGNKLWDRFQRRKLSAM